MWRSGVCPPKGPTIDSISKPSRLSLVLTVSDHAIQYYSVADHKTRQLKRSTLDQKFGNEGEKG